MVKYESGNVEFGLENCHSFSLSRNENGRISIGYQGIGDGCEYTLTNEEMAELKDFVNG